MLPVDFRPCIMEAAVGGVAGGGEGGVELTDLGPSLETFLPEPS